MKILGIFILVLGCLKFVNCEYSLTILLNEFSNGQGFLEDGDHCSSFWFAGEQCNIQLTIRVDTSPKGSSSCNNNMTQTIFLGNVTSNSNKIVFNEQKYGSWVNPQIFHYNGSYNGFQLCIEAREATSGALIDSFAADRINGQRVDDFTAFSHQRLNETIDPTLILYAWSVKGDMIYPQSTRPIQTTTTLPPLNLPVDCEDALAKKIITSSQITEIVLSDNTKVSVWCEVQGQTAQTVIQSRGDVPDDVKFDMQNMANFKGILGTPSANGHFWLGLDNMNLLTTGRNVDYNLTIIVCCGNTESARQFYSGFKIGDSASGYKLQGTALQHHGLNYDPSDFNRRFSTNDSYRGPFREVCSAASFIDNPQGNIGGWWFGSCSNNLNGHYYSKTDDVWDDVSQCTLNQDKVKAPQGLGSGIELNTKPISSDTDFIDWVSYTRARMAVYRADGNGVPTTSNFCN